MSVKSYLVHFYFGLRHFVFYFRKIIIRLYSPDNGEFSGSESHLQDSIKSLKRLGWMKLSSDRLLIEPDKLKPLIERANYLLNSQNELKETASKVTTIDKNFKVAIDDLFDRSELLNVINDKNIVKVAKGYLNTKPFLRQASVWWDCPVPGEERDSQTFHADGDDPNLLKVFIYLNDVSKDDGPFVFIEKSHLLLRKFFLILKYGVASIKQCDIKNEDAKNIKYCVGKAGDIFMADTNGFHKGLKADKNSKGRILLHLIFCSEWPIGSSKSTKSLVPLISVDDLSI